MLFAIGAGKEVVARCLHEKGPRADHPLVIVDCGSVVDTLIDSEFFGHEKGAYTGAANRRLGWFETAAKGGTLFLDEIGNLSAMGQKALLRALEERVIHRVGSTTPISIDVGDIAATNQALEERIDRAGFREDLFFRLAEYVIVLPPLRARREDIGFLAGGVFHPPPRPAAPPAAASAGEDEPDQQRTMSRIDSSPATSPASTTTRCRNPPAVIVVAACCSVHSGDANTTSAVR